MTKAQEPVGDEAAPARPDGAGPVPGPPSPRRRRQVTAGLFRALATTIALVTLYYVAPLGVLSGVPAAVTLAGGLVVLSAATAWQVRAVLVSSHPAIRAIESVAAMAPLFLLLFAGTYYVLARSHPEYFSVTGLDRTDTLYFTVTVFTTVGFGDITATSQLTRIVVTLQMILDLIVLGLGVRVFLGAVRLGRDRNTASGRPTSTTMDDPESR
jgi:voltage-gated potassium channel